MGINNVALFLKETGGSYLRELLENAAKKNLRRNCGKTRYILQGKELESLNLQYTFGNIKNPKIVIGNNSSKGSSLWGATIFDDAGKPFDSYAIAYDITRGKEPIIQTRWQKFFDGKKVFTNTEYTDLNKVVNKNTTVTNSMVEENGVLKASTSFEDAFATSFSSSLTRKEAADIESKTGIYMQSKDWIKFTVKGYSDKEVIRDTMKSIKKQFHHRPSAFYRKALMVEKMDLPAIAKETELQLQNLENCEKELDSLYEQIIGAEAGSKSWQKDFINNDIPIINIKTGKTIQKTDFIKLKRKMRRYSDIRSLLMMLTEQKQKLNNFQLYDSKYIEQAIERYGIKVSSSIDKNLVTKLNAIKSLPPVEIMTKAKDIICEHFKLPKDMIKVAEAPANYKLEPFTAAFVLQLGKIVYHPECTKLPADTLIALIGHEVDHCYIFTKTAKSIGLENFKKIISHGSQEAENLFNDKLWSEIIKKVELGDFDAANYIQAIKNYKPLSSLNYRQNISYMSNPLEQRAYQIGFDIQQALNGGNIECPTTLTLIKSKIYGMLEEKINILKNIVGADLDEYLCVKTLQERALRTLENPTCFELDLEIGEKMLVLIDKGIQKALKENLKYPKIN